jgi:hypothetical protein
MTALYHLEDMRVNCQKITRVAEELARNLPPYRSNDDSFLLPKVWLVNNRGIL